MAAGAVGPPAACQGFGAPQGGFGRGGLQTSHVPNRVDRPRAPVWTQIFSGERVCPPGDFIGSGRGGGKGPGGLRTPAGLANSYSRLPGEVDELHIHTDAN